MEVEAVFSKSKSYPSTNFRSTSAVNDSKLKHEFVDVVSLDPLPSKNVSEITSEKDEFDPQGDSKNILRIRTSSLSLKNDGVGCREDMNQNEETSKICNTKKSGKLSFSITSILQACTQRSNKSHGSANTRFKFRSGLSL